MIKFLASIDSVAVRPVKDGDPVIRVTMTTELDDDVLRAVAQALAYNVHVAVDRIQLSLADLPQGEFEASDGTKATLRRL